VSWPSTRAELCQLQDELGRTPAVSWAGPGHVGGGCFVCFARGGPGPGARGDRGWAGAALVRRDGDPAVAVVQGTAGARYEVGFLALREGPLVEAAVRALPRPPDVLLVNSTGCDHPRRAGLALHLGALLDLPTVGVTHRTLLAEGEWPPDEAGASAPLFLGGEVVGYWVRTRTGTRPLAVHAAWRTDPDTAAETALAWTRGARTPEPIRLARTAARRARAGRPASPPTGPPSSPAGPEAG
jgi:deoxyribonuclease V